MPCDLVQSPKSRVQSPKSKVQSPRPDSKTLVCSYRGPTSDSHILPIGLWTLDIGLWTLDFLLRRGLNHDQLIIDRDDTVYSANHALDA